jgi:endonuclease/exonuclease/phosphatase family metal-dependent hydrolase
VKSQIRKSFLPAIIVLSLFLFSTCTTTPSSKREISVNSSEAAADNDVFLNAATFNIGDADGTVPTLIEVIHSIEQFGAPDLLFLQEVQNPGFLDDLVHYFGYSDSVHGYYLEGSPFLIAILSRYPLSHPTEIRNPSGSLIALFSTVNVPGGNDILTGSIHLVPIEKPRDDSGYVKNEAAWMTAAAFRETFTSTDRTKGLTQIRKWIDGQSVDSVIIAGDFNTIRMSKTIRRMKWFFKDGTRMSREYFGGTYEKVQLPFFPRSDYLYYKGSLKSGNPWILKETPGDHFPIGARFRTPNKQE